MPLKSLQIDSAVRERYSAAAAEREIALCCPVEYDSRLLQIIPAEVLDRDYGCGDPSRHVQPGETVLDLGCGGGKVCFIAAQVVGPEGRVIGVDCNDEMLGLARRSAPLIADRIGFANVSFLKARIQDLALDLDTFDAHLRRKPVGSASDWLAAQEHADELRHTQPLIPDESIDVVVSNCVLNLVRPGDREQLFAELFRVLKLGGRAVISDIVAGAEVPEELQGDPELWSGCISGAYQEEQFLAAFEAAGFHGIELLDRQSAPWQVVAGIEFRSVTVRAWKPIETAEHAPHSVIYRGPWKAVMDDAESEYVRGRPVAVTAATWQRLSQPPFAGQFLSAGDDPSTPGACAGNSDTPRCC